jgi:ATP synthase protein I
VIFTLSLAVRPPLFLHRRKCVVSGAPVWLQKRAVTGTFRRAMGDGGGALDPRPKAPHGAPQPVRLGSVAAGGVELAVTILIGLFAGQWVDRRLGTGPWVLVLGMFAGAAAGFYSLYRTLKTADSRAASRDSRSRDVGRRPPSE